MHGDCFKSYIDCNNWHTQCLVPSFSKVDKAMKTHKEIILMTRKKSIIIIDDGFMGKPMNKELGFVTGKGTIHMVFFLRKIHLQDMVVQSDGRSTSSQMLFSKRESVATLALGLRPKQGLARLSTKREAREWRNATTLALGSRPKQKLTRLWANKKA